MTSDNMAICIFTHDFIYEQILSNYDIAFHSNNFGDVSNTS